MTSRDSIPIPSSRGWGLKFGGFRGGWPQLVGTAFSVPSRDVSVKAGELRGAGRGRSQGFCVLLGFLGGLGFGCAGPLPCLLGTAFPFRLVATGCSGRFRGGLPRLVGTEQVPKHPARGQETIERWRSHGISSLHRPQTQRCKTPL